jgi:predicted ATP-grasp superfamily ATP-dependent carboligase
MNKVLIVATECDWWGIARLPESLKEEGFDVSVLCPQNSLLTKTRFVDSVFTYWSPLSLFMLFLLIRAFYKSKADLIIPGDDYSTVCLQNFVSSQSIISKLIPRQLRKVLQKSTGDQKWFSVMNNKRDLQDHAEKLGIRTPSNRAVSDLDSALVIAKEICYPVVVKLDQGFGGQEVRICSSESDLKDYFKELVLVRKSSVLTWLKELTKKIFLVKYIHAEAGVSIQKYIKGKPAYYTFFSRNGVLPAGITAMAIKTHPGETGPSCVINIVEHNEIQLAAKKIVELISYTGFGGVDFIVDEDNNAYLLEFNPRVTAISYLAKELGANLCAMLRWHLEDKDYKSLIGLPVKHKIIALYPKEFKRNPDSDYLKTGFHDIPQYDPGLLVKN